MDQGSGLPDHWPLFNDRILTLTPDPRSKGQRRYITIDETLDQGSVLVATWNMQAFPQHNQKLSQEFPNFKCSTTSQIEHLLK